MKSLFFSIRVRFIFIILAVILLVMSISGLLLFSFLRQYFLSATETSLIAQAQLTAQVLLPGSILAGPSIENQTPFSNAVQQNALSNLALQAENIELPAEGLSQDTLDLDYLQNATLQLGSQLNTHIRILNPQGDVLIDASGIALDDEVNIALIATAQSGEQASDTIEIDEQMYMRLAAPAYIGDELAGIIYLSQPLQDIFTVLDDLRARWVMATSIAAVLAAIAGFFFSNAITKPIQKLTKATSAVAGGQLDYRVDLQSKDELGHLGKMFNQMTGQLQAARQTQTDFVANVSHELRTPLTSIKGMVETLREGAVDDLRVRDRFLETIETETDRLTRMVNELLTLSLADSESLNLRLAQVNLDDLIPRVIEKLEPLADEKDIHIHFENRSPDVRVQIDPDRIEQVVINILDNAIKYSQPENEIQVLVSNSTGAFIQVAIRDHGVGISQNDLARLGERFYRTDKARSRAQGGSGLGLAIANALVQAHGGRTHIESQEGQGTTVTFTIPKA
ncbi:MAG: HAMP domain-containing protein [Anaerolineales bacterium]|nr:HAMP domain-containing protein [Anaerolineales bacterium]